MKAMSFIIASLLINTFALANTPSTDPVKEIAVGINGVYVPAEFVSTQNAYVVVNGLFPNGCYTLIEPKVKHVSTYEHDVMTMAKVRQGICLRVLVPFTQEIPLGKLAKGQHNLRFVAEDGTAIEKQIEIF